MIKAFVLLITLVCQISFAEEVEQASVKMTETPSDMFEDSTDEIKVQTISVEDIGGESYISPEVKRAQEYKYYDNTYLYVTLRSSYLVKQNGEPVTNAVRSFYNNKVERELGRIFKPKLKKAFDTHF